jgi:succinate-semialdehyde dehydrogenase/glutarate-semialdehyde dehydrogenase
VKKQPSIWQIRSIGQLKEVQVLLGGKRADREGAFMEPTILTDLKPGIAYHEELFGPVASFYVVTNRLPLIWPMILGLGGSIFTQDIERGKE